MVRIPAVLFICMLVLVSLQCLSADDAVSSATSPYAKWSHGPPSDPAFFPLAVWLQSPANAERYKQAGFNTYVGLWKGPTEDQLATLKKAGMHVICAQNGTALRHVEDPTIIGWLQDDEPDNAQSLGQGKGWGPPVPPEKIIRIYRGLQAADPTRPVLLNLGQGVAWDDYYGRGTRTRHPEDYPQYLEGCDVASFDIYPIVHERRAVAGKLWFVAQGVERLVKWAEGKRIVWNCLECTHISNPDRKATPHDVRAEAWMSLIHGSRGLIFFVHQFKPRFREAALLDDAEMLAAITALNHQIAELAPVLNSPATSKPVSVKSQNVSVPVASLTKQHQGSTYVFAVAMRPGETTAEFNLKGLGAGDHTIEVLGENRTIKAEDDSFRDKFGPWDVHLYRVLPN